MDPEIETDLRVEKIGEVHAEISGKILCQALEWPPGLAPGVCYRNVQKMASEIAFWRPNWLYEDSTGEWTDSRS